MPLSELQIGYLAGILDGEGAIGIVLYHRKDRQNTTDIRPQVRITQRRKKLLTTILSWIGEENGTIGKAGLDGKYFVLRFKNGWLRHELPAISEHLILKRRQAEIVLYFLNNAKRPGVKGLGEAEWVKRVALRNECVALNADRTNAET